MRVLGHDQPYIASEQRSLERLLLSETCRIAYEYSSAIAVVGGKWLLRQECVGLQALGVSG